MSSIHEREVKIIGPLSALTQAFNNISKNITTTSDTYYTFTTTYMDTPDRVLQRQGYTLRYRPNRNRFPPCIELKQIDGADGEVSERIEIGVRIRDAEFLSLYFNLLSNPDVREQGIIVPYYTKLNPIYEIQADRHEVGGVILTNDRAITIETALDNVRYLKDGNIIGRDNELEIEDKNPTNEAQQILAFAKSRVTKDVPGVEYTTLSKSSRARQFLIDLNLDI